MLGFSYPQEQKRHQSLGGAAAGNSLGADNSFAGLIYRIDGTIGCKDFYGSSMYQYCSEKPGGWDIGHIIQSEDKKYIIKSGISKSIFSRALELLAEGSNQRADGFVKFVASNYLRLANISDADVVERCQEIMVRALKEYASKNTTKELIENIRNGYKVNINDAAKIFDFFAQFNGGEARDIISFPLFADLIAGTTSQHLTNRIQQEQFPKLEIATQQLFVEKAPNGNRLYMGSKFLDNAEALNKFLLEHNGMSAYDENAKEKYLEEFKNRLMDKFRGKNLKGLCSSILWRHMLGESSDLGPDNMLVHFDTSGYDIYVMNIDTTGFRYKRKDDFFDKPTDTIRLGWSDTFKSMDENELLERIFSPTVFSKRFVTESNIPKDLVPEIYDIVVSVLKYKVRDIILAEIKEYKEIVLRLDFEPIADDMNAFIDNVYSLFPENLKFDKSNLEILKNYNRGFLEDMIPDSVKSRPLISH